MPFLILQILCFGKAGNNSSAVRSSMFGTKKQFKIFKGQTNTDADNKDSKQSTGGDKGVAICTPTSSKTFISDAMSQSNKKMNGNQTNVATTISPGTNMQVPLKCIYKVIIIDHYFSLANYPQVSINVYQFFSDESQ